MAGIEPRRASLLTSSIARTDACATARTVGGFVDLPKTSAAIQVTRPAALSDLDPDSLATLISELDDAIAESRPAVHPLLAVLGVAQVLFGAVSVARGSIAAGWVMGIAGAVQIVLFWLSAVSKRHQNRSLETVLERADAQRLHRAVAQGRRFVLSPEGRRAAAERLTPRKELLRLAVVEQLGRMQ